MSLYQKSPNLPALSLAPSVAPMRVRRPAVSPHAPKIVTSTAESDLDKLIQAAKVRQLQQQRLTANHKTFFNEILGDEDPDPVFQELCDFLDTPHRYKLILLPRGTRKTSRVTIGSTIKKIAEDPNSRTLIVSELLKNSKKMLGAVEAQFESNPQLIQSFGRLVPKRDEGKWNDTEMVVTSRTNYQAKEATVTAAGLDVEQTSTHYDRIILDDLMSRNNTKTKEQIEAVIEYVKLVYALLDPSPHAEMIVIGTRWHFADLYNYLIEEGKYEVFRRGAYADEAKTVLAFPHILNHEFLNEQKTLLGSGHFANQYLNIPQDDDSAKFKYEWLQTFVDADVPKGCRVMMMIDPAISKEETADETAIVTVAVDYEHRWFVLEERHGRWNPYEITMQTFEAVRLWHPHEVGLEKHGFQETLQYFFDQEMAKQNVFFSVTDLKADSNTNKDMRIEGLIPLFESKKIFLRDKQSELAWQLLKYPKYPHDDLCDALSHGLQIVGPGSKMPHQQEIPANSLLALHASAKRRAQWEWSLPQAKPGTVHVW